MIYKSITKVVIDDYRWLAYMNRIDGDKLESFGSNLFIEAKPVDTKPKQFDIRELEAQARMYPGTAYYFRGKRVTGYERV